MSEALKNTKNNKSPGLDGIPYEFYKFFWNDIGEYLLASLNYSYEQGQLSINQRQGVISLLPKGKKDTLYLTNWRPITLLCTDYKLVSKVIASRLKQTLTHIINASQTGFVSGRYIGENINTILQIIELTEDENIPGLIMSADFSQAFDNLDWDYLDRVLKYFNFGESFRKWVKLFNTNISAVVNVNGWFTNYFNIKQGARQGDPIAAYLFIICAELLGHSIRTSENINGINIGHYTYTISQFADDKVIFLDGTKLSLKTLALSVSYTGLCWGASHWNAGQKQFCITLKFTYPYLPTSALKPWPHRDTTCCDRVGSGEILDIYDGPRVRYDITILGFVVTLDTRVCDTFGIIIEKSYNRRTRSYIITMIGC